MTEAAPVDNLASARRLYESGLAPAVLAELAHETDFRLVEPEALPYGGVYEGVAALRALGKKMAEAFSEIRLEYIGVTGDGDTVVGELVLHATTRRSGSVIAMPILELLRFRDGRIVEIRPYYFDTAAVVAAL